MRIFASIFILTIVALVAYADEAQDREDEVKWVEFKKVHGKQYHHSEEAKRKTRFIERDRKIKTHNSGNHSFKMAHNKFSDQTEEERKAVLGAVIPPTELSRSYEQFYADISEEDMRQCTDNTTVDYRTNRCLGPVKNQAQCGSCWAFAAMAPLEFSKCKLTGTYVSLSEQQLVDCDPYDGGCNGGWYSNAWNYLKNKSNGTNPTSFYAYTAKGGACKFSSTNVVTKVASYGSVPKDVTAIKAALVKYGPLAVAIQVQSSFYSYYSGIYADSTCPTDGTVNHAVNIVGYGNDFWIVRNSWGASWGNKGYIQMKMGVNMCSIESWVYYVVAA